MDLFSELTLRTHTSYRCYDILPASSVLLYYYNDTYNYCPLCRHHLLTSDPELRPSIWQVCEVVSRITGTTNHVTKMYWDEAQSQRSTISSIFIYHWIRS